MKIRRKYFLLLFLPLVYFACRKDKVVYPTIVDVTFKDYWTGAPIDSGIVYIYQNYNLLAPPYYHTDTVAIGMTDENGHFHAQFATDDEVDGVGLLFDKAPWYIENGGISGASIIKNTVNNLDLKIKGYTFINVHIKNTTPFDQFDFLQFGSSYLYGNGYTGAGFFDGIGTNIDTTITLRAKSYNYQSFYVGLGWSITKNSVLHNGSDSIFCQTLNQYYYNLNY